MGKKYTLYFSSSYVKDSFYREDDCLLCLNKPLIRSVYLMFSEEKQD